MTRADPSTSVGCRSRPLPSRRAAERRWPLSRVFAVGAAVAAVIVLAVLATGGYAIWRLVEVRTVAAQVGTPGLLTGQRLSVALVNEESGVRGFAATGRPEFLEPYLHRAAGRAGLRWPQLRALAPRGLRDFGPRAGRACRPAVDGLADRLRRSRCSIGAARRRRRTWAGPGSTRSAAEPRPC